MTIINTGANAASLLIGDYSSIVPLLQSHLLSTCADDRGDGHRLTHSRPHLLFAIDISTVARDPVADANGSNSGMSSGHTQRPMIIAPRQNACAAAVFSPQMRTITTRTCKERPRVNLAHPSQPPPSGSEAQEAGSAGIEGAFEKRKPGAGKEADKVDVWMLACARARRSWCSGPSQSSSP